MHAPVASRPSHALNELGDQAREGARQASPWIEGLGRFGYAAKGIVYLILGGLALQAALGQGGQVTDQKGALTSIAEYPFGKVMLASLFVGLLGYALWRGAQAIFDTENHGSDAKGIALRVLEGGVAFIYVGLAISALRIAMGASSGASSTQQTQGWTAWLMDQPFGVWLVGLIGAAVVANGIAQFIRAFGDKLTEKLRRDEMTASQVEWVTRIGRAGYSARGVAFVTIGGLLIAAALHHNPGEAQGLDGALATLAAQPFGPYLLILVTAGLAAYGLYALIEARYRRMVLY
jgi:hypothetical protein